MCEHKYILLDTKKYAEPVGYASSYTRIDSFFCERCLDIKELKRESCERNAPEWY